MTWALVEIPARLISHHRSSFLTRCHPLFESRICYWLTDMVCMPFALPSAARSTTGLQYAEIKLESLILAQSERWRRA